MRVSTDDGRFGFVVSPLNNDMFRFQIIVSGQLLGDEEPCILGSAMYQLGHLEQLGDDRLGDLAEYPAEVFSVLRADELLHDAASLSLAESLDQWLIYGYIFEGQVIMVAREHKSGGADGTILVSALDKAEYDSIFDVIQRYWSTTRSGSA